MHTSTVKKLELLCKAFVLLMILLGLLGIAVLKRATPVYNDLSTRGFKEATVVSVADDGSSVVLTYCLDAASRMPGIDNKTPQPQTLAINSKALQSQVKSLRIGDEIWFEQGSDASLTALSVKTVQVNSMVRVASLLFAFAILLAVTSGFTNVQPWNLIIGLDRRFSNSQTQLALWTVVVLTAYVSTLILRVWAGGLGFLAGVDIPTNVLGMTSISALSFGGARAITGWKATAAGPAAVIKNRAAQASLIKDLSQDNKQRVDIGDFQMIFISMLAFIVYILVVFHYLGQVALTVKASLPDVDTTLLTGFGVGQGAYLFKKLGSSFGEG